MITNTCGLEDCFHSFYIRHASAPRPLWLVQGLFGSDVPELKEGSALTNLVWSRDGSVVANRGLRLHSNREVDFFTAAYDFRTGEMLTYDRFGSIQLLSLQIKILLAKRGGIMPAKNVIATTKSIGPWAWDRQPYYDAMNQP